jgi:hypothetical protein
LVDVFMPPMLEPRPWVKVKPLTEPSSPQTSEVEVGWVVGGLEAGG